MSNQDLLIGSHVSMGGKDMLVQAANESIYNDANTMMVFTGAPQNTRRKPISEFNIPAGEKLLKEHNISPIVVHAPYIINLGNTFKPESLEFAIGFMGGELDRAEAINASTISLHPGAAVGAEPSAAITQIAKSLDEVFAATNTTKVNIGLETMAGKGTEIGGTFEQLASIIEQSKYPERLMVTFDTCHVYDAGYDIKSDLDGVLNEFDKIIGLKKISAIHLNDSKFGLASHKDRHTYLGFGEIGWDTLETVAYLPEFAKIPKLLETPFVPSPTDPKKKYPTYKAEIAELRTKTFDPKMPEHVLNSGEKTTSERE